jgi:hypothetical protein
MKLLTIELLEKGDGTGLARALVFDRDDETGKFSVTDILEMGGQTQEEARREVVVFALTRHKDVTHHGTLARNHPLRWKTRRANVRDILMKRAADEGVHQ